MAMETMTAISWVGTFSRWRGLRSRSRAATSAVGAVVMARRLPKAGEDQELPGHEGAAAEPLGRHPHRYEGERHQRPAFREEGMQAEEEQGEEPQGAQGGQEGPGLSPAQAAAARSAAVSRKHLFPPGLGTTSDRATTDRILTRASSRWPKERPGGIGPGGSSVRVLPLRPPMRGRGQEAAVDQAAGLGRNGGRPRKLPCPGR
jgi:hypothetical protein